MTDNFIFGVGRLTTDRYAFQNHVDGYLFKHKADGILLDPKITINEVEQSTVQQAIAAIAENLEPTSLPEANIDGTKGIITLQGGDLAGTGSTASIVRVSGIQGKKIANLGDIANNYVLTWDATSSSFQAKEVPNQFSAGGDLYGTNIDQKVARIAGHIGRVNINCSTLEFSDSIDPILIYQDSGIPVKDMIIRSQSNYSTESGNLKLETGNATDNPGSIILALNESNIGLELAQLQTGINLPIISLFNNSELTTTEMPLGTGSKVIYIHDTSDPPTTGSPVDGSILYSKDGTLWIKQSNGDNFKIKFTADGDLDGDSTSQDVIAISGHSDTAEIKCSNLIFDKSVFPIISQESDSMLAREMIIRSQGSSSFSASLSLSSGLSGVNNPGSVILALNESNIGLELAQLQTGINLPIISLFNDSKLTTTEMPLGTGSKVIYIHDTSNPPTTGRPVNGSILYSKAGTLWVKQSDGADFQIQIKNPSVDGYLLANNIYVTRDTSFEFDTTSTSFVEALRIPSSGTIAVNDGDLIKLSFTGLKLHGMFDADGYYCLVIVKGGASTTIEGSGIYSNNKGGDRYIQGRALSLQGIYKIDANTNIYAYLAVKSISGYMAVGGSCTLIMEVLRPYSFV